LREWAKYRSRDLFPLLPFGLSPSAPLSFPFLAEKSGAKNTRDPFPAGPQLPFSLASQGQRFFCILPFFQPLLSHRRILQDFLEKLRSSGQIRQPKNVWQQGDEADNGFTSENRSVFSPVKIFSANEYCF